MEGAGGSQVSGQCGARYRQSCSRMKMWVLGVGSHAGLTEMVRRSEGIWVEHPQNYVMCDTQVCEIMEHEES